MKDNECLIQRNKRSIISDSRKRKHIEDRMEEKVLVGELEIITPHIEHRNRRSDSTVVG